MESGFLPGLTPWWGFFSCNKCVFGLERVEALLSVWLALWGWSLCLWSPPFRQSPLQPPEVSGSLLSVLSVPAVSGPAKGPFVPLRGWGPLQRSCVCAPCNPFFFFLIQRENGLHGVCATELGGSSVRGVCGVEKGWGDRSGCVWAGWIAKPGLGTWVMGEHMVMMSTWGG
jgi:hypothetical protein